MTPVLQSLLRAAPAPSPRAARMLDLLAAWRAAGSSRLDRDLDGVMDAGPGPAIWDAFYPRLYDAVMPNLPGLDDIQGTDPGPRSGMTDAGFWYLDKDLRRLTGERFKAPFNRRYCGDGNRAACARAVWAALEAVPGDPDAMRADATQGADQVPARVAADDDPLHEPPERHPAGDLLPRPSAETDAGPGRSEAMAPAPASMRPVPVSGYGRMCSTTP